VPDKGMPPWGPVLTPEEIHSVVAYIHSIRGSKPAGAKAPQGDKVVE
jgi:cytochrome c oxidase cbb3-type subunit 3